MKSVFNYLVVFLVFLLFYGGKPSQQWEFLPEHSKVTFNIRNAGINVSGEFKEFDAKIVFNPDDPSASSINGTIKVNSIETGIGKRDRDLRSDNYFHAEKFPEINFRSKSVKHIEAAMYEIKGVLTIKDVSKNITLKVRYIESKRSAAFRTTINLNRRDFNVGGRSLILSDDLSAEILIVARKK